jgi:hypothetical protein
MDLVQPTTIPSSIGFLNEMTLIEDEKMLFHRREQLWIIFFISSTKENDYGYSSSTKRNYGSFAKNMYEDILETSCCGRIVLE